MNNIIINQLISEARTHYPATKSSGEYWVLNEHKFAELLIRECCSEIESVGIGDYVRDEWDLGYEKGIQQAIETIKEYFGVKDE